MTNRNFPPDLPRERDTLLCHIFICLLWSGHGNNRTVGEGESI